TLFDADHCSGTDLQSLSNLAAGQVLNTRFIGFEQHAGCRLLMSCGLASTDQLVQFLLLLFREMDGVAFFTHGRSPLLLREQIDERWEKCEEDRQDQECH